MGCENVWLGFLTDQDRAVQDVPGSAGPCLEFSGKPLRQTIALCVNKEGNSECGGMF